MSEILWFQLVKCEDVLHVPVLYHCKFKYQLQECQIWTVCPRKRTPSRHDLTFANLRHFVE